ncbi:MAG: Ig-like domain-containing domain [Leadbetterella sp.]
MKKPNTSDYFLYSIILLFGIFILSCAQFVPPTGGEQDKTPPVLLESFPKNKSLKVKGKTIELTFDEYVDMASVSQELITIPAPISPFTTKMKGKTVKLIFEKPFQDSTTYTFNFRNGIKDINERNPAENLKLVFSTGTFIDSLQISGKVRDIYTKSPSIGATLGLYREDTIPLLKRKPSYFIKTDSSGLFSLENIKNGTYKVFAFSDANNNLLFDYKTETIGFSTVNVDLNKNIKLPLIELFRINSAKNKIKKTNSKDLEYLITLDKPVKEVIMIEPKNTEYQIKNNTILHIYNLTQTYGDSTLCKFIAVDSLNKRDTLSQKYFFTKSTRKPKIGTVSIESKIKNREAITRTLEYEFTFDLPISKFNEDSVVFKVDTLVSKKPTFVWESKTKLKASLKTTAQKQVQLIFKDKTFTNIKGDTSETVSITNPILQEKELAQLSGTATGKDNKIIQLLYDDKFKIYKEIQTKSSFSFVDIIPNSYYLKIIYDDNNNGIWDPGDITTGQLPEKIDLSKEPMRLKANFILKNVNIDQLVEKPVE